MKIKLRNCKLGIAPINWINDDLPELGKHINFEQLLSEIALAKFQGTEIGNAFPKEINELKYHLKLRNLQIASAWFSSYVLEKGFQETFEKFKLHVDFLKQLNSKVVVVSEQSFSIQGLDKSLIKDKPYFNDEQFKQIAQALNEFGKYSLSQGLLLVYHHHMGTGIQTWLETQKLLNLTNENYVFLVFDTGHFTYAGEDINTIYPLCHKRVKHIHLKDVRFKQINKLKDQNLSFLQGVKNGTFTIPGDGDIDFESFFKLLAKFDYQGWLLVEAEQDPIKAHPLTYALQAKKFIDKYLEIQNG